MISDGTSIAGTAQRILEIGKPVDTYYMKEWAGVNPEDGKPQWYMDDANGNKVVTDSYSKASYYKCGKSSARRLRQLQHLCILQELRPSGQLRLLTWRSDLQLLLVRSTTQTEHMPATATR